MPVERNDRDRRRLREVALSKQLSAALLESPRLRLEPLQLDQEDELATILDDEALHRFIGGRPPTRAELRSRLERQVQGHSPDGSERWLNWVIRERRSGALVGTTQATVREDGAALAWVVGSAHQGRGIAKETAGLVAAWLRDQGIARLTAHIHPDHGASIAVARSIGLKPTQEIVDGEVVWR